MNSVEKVRKEILELLEENNINTNEIHIDGVNITRNLMVRIVNIIRENNSYSSIRGHVKFNERFNVSYETGYLSYERFSDEFYFGNATISYKSLENKYKLFVSDANWIDIHINYDEKSYATIVVVPKNKSELEKEIKK